MGDEENSEESEESPGVDVEILYDLLRDNILKIGKDIVIENKKHYIAYKVKNDNFLAVKKQRNRLKLYLRGRLKDSKNLVRDVSRVGHHGTGKSLVILNSADNLGYILDLVKQAYESLEDNER